MLIQGEIVTVLWRLGQIERYPGDAVQGYDVVNTAACNGFFGHAVHDAGGFILGDGLCAVVMHFLHAVGPIRSHAGHNDAHGVASGKTRDRFKKHVYTGPVPGDQGA